MPVRALKLWPREKSDTTKSDSTDGNTILSNITSGVYVNVRAKSSMLLVDKDHTSCCWSMRTTESKLLLDHILTHQYDRFVKRFVLTNWGSTELSCFGKYHT